MKNALVAGLVLVAIIWGLKALSGRTPETTPSQTTLPTRSITADKPRFYPSTAIGIAQKHCLESPVNAGERRAAAHIRRLKATGVLSYEDENDGFDATYLGNGEWTVILRIYSEPGQALNLWSYRWKVSENTANAIFIAETSVYP